MAATGTRSFPFSSVIAVVAPFGNAVYGVRVPDRGAVLIFRPVEKRPRRAHDEAVADLPLLQFAADELQLPAGLRARDEKIAV